MLPHARQLARTDPPCLVKDEHIALAEQLVILLPGPPGLIQHRTFAGAGDANHHRQVSLPREVLEGLALLRLETAVGQHLRSVNGGNSALVACGGLPSPAGTEGLVGQQGVEIEG